MMVPVMRSPEWKRTRSSSPTACFHKAGGQTAPLIRREHSRNKQFRCRLLTSFPVRTWVGVSGQRLVRSGGLQRQSH